MKKVFKRFFVAVFLMLLMLSQVAGVSATELDLGIPVEDHPELLSNKNVIADDDPMLGATGEDW
jgi:hypothetical protein